MTVALIGSYAWGPLVGLQRTPSDLDLVGPYREVAAVARWWLDDIKSMGPFKGGTKFHATDGVRHVEADLVFPDTLQERILQAIMDCNRSVTLTLPRGEAMTFHAPDLDLAYMMKLTHRYLRNSPHFLKTMRDIQLMRKAGAKVRDEHKQLFKDMEKETLSYKHPNLDQSKKSFFTDEVQYTYDHDDIHKAVAVENAPAYTKYQVDGSEVLCSKEKFFTIEERQRLNGVIEEAMVLAIERSLVPHPGVLTPEDAFLKALMKVCTSITSGWFREYAWENYDYAVRSFRFLQGGRGCYWDVFNEALAEGRVRPHGH